MKGAEVEKDERVGRPQVHGLVFLLGAALLSAQACGRAGADEAGVWQLEDVKASHPSKKELAPRYPWNCKGRVGDTTSEIGIGHLNPPGRQRVRLTWTAPPDALTPGEPVSIVLSAEMLVNDTRGAAYVGCDFSADIEAVDMADSYVSREGRVRFGDGTVDRISLTEKTAPGTVVRLNGRAAAPSFGALKSGETGKIQVRVMIHHQYLLVYHYIYKWVPRPEKAVDVAKKDAALPVSTAEPTDAAGRTSAKPTATTRVMSGGFPKNDLPPVEEEEAQTVAAQGAVLRLPSGGKLSIPPGALKGTDAIVFRRLAARQKDTALYHIESSVGSLEVPAELELPLPATPPADREYAALVVLFHNESDPGRLLPAEFRKGDRLVKVKTKEMSVIAVAIIWGTVATPIVTEVYMRTVNTDERLLQAIAAAKAGAKDPAILIRAPYYWQNKTMWCWASCLAMAVHAANGTTKNLEKPQKPQTIASVVGAETDSGLGGWRFWVGSSCQPFAYVRESTGAEVEPFRWIHYADLIQYIFTNLANRCPVVVDVQAHIHTIVIVGYDADGFWVQDPAIPDVPVGHVPWAAFLGIIKETSTQLVRGVNTTVIKRKVEDANNSVLSINVPSCTLGGRIGAESNRHGCYFATPYHKAEDFPRSVTVAGPAGPTTVPHPYAADDENAFQYTGFAWNGFRPEAEGMTPATGPKGEARVDPLAVGTQTVFGFNNIEITNVSAAPVQCSMKVVLVDPADKEEIELVKETPYTVPGKTSGADSYLDKGCGGRLLCASQGDIPFLPLLPSDKRGARGYILRFSLWEGGKEVDRVHLPLTVNPLRIDNIVTTTVGEGMEYRLTGSGFEMKGMQVILIMGANRQVPLNTLEVEPMTKLSVKDFQTASFTLPAKLQPLAICLRAGNGLESNAYPLVGKPFKLTLRHEGGATLGPGNNVLKIACSGELTGPAGTTATARPLLMHGAQLLDVFAATAWEGPLQINLNVQYSLSEGTKWRWDCTVPGHNGAAFGQTMLTNPRLEVIPNAPQHASCKSTQALPALNVLVPPGPRLAALSGTGQVSQQYSGLVALVFDKAVRIYEIHVERKDGKLETTNVFSQAETDKFMKDQGAVAKIYLLHFQVDRNP